MIKLSASLGCERAPPLPSHLTQNIFQRAVGRRIINMPHIYHFACYSAHKTSSQRAHGVNTARMQRSQEAHNVKVIYFGQHIYNEYSNLFGLIEAICHIIYKCIESCVVCNMFSNTHMLCTE